MQISRKMARRYFDNLNDIGKKQAFVIAMAGETEEIVLLEQYIAEFNLAYPDMDEAEEMGLLDDLDKLFSEVRCKDVSGSRF